MGAIYAKDFASNLHDKRGNGETTHSWNAGGLRHVIKVLQGRPVAIELDTMTGYTRVGVTLVDVRSRLHGGEGIAVADPSCVTPQNPQGITVHDVRKVGVIIPLESGFGSDKYDAIDSERRERDIVRELFHAEMGQLPAGTSEFTSYAYKSGASHTPTSYKDGHFQYRHYTLEQVQAASLCDHCLLNRESQQHEHHCPEFAKWLDARREERAQA